MIRPSPPSKGRGAASNPEGRFESRTREPFDDGWLLDDTPPPAIQTRVFVDHAKTVIARNDSPDIPFSQSINPYRGCEHGCIYCYARPSHAYLNLSPGLDFETRLFYKPDAAKRLEAELRAPNYRCSMISLGANTDPYQPVERELGITRSLLEVLLRFRHPVGIVTKGTAVMARDLDLLQALAAENLLNVAISITTLDDELKRRLEPRTASGSARLRIVEKLSAAGIPTLVFFSPVIPFINDAEMETVLKAAREAGAQAASYALLRLPHEVKNLFREWLDEHAPLKAAHVMSLVRQTRGGRDYDASYEQRMSGQGEYARVLETRFRAACRRLGFADAAHLQPDGSRFRVPAQAGDQLGLGF